MARADRQSAHTHTITDLFPTFCNSRASWNIPDSHARVEDAFASWNKAALIQFYVIGTRDRLLLTGNAHSRGTAEYA